MIRSGLSIFRENVSLMQPHKLDRPNKQDRLTACFNPIGCKSGLDMAVGSNRFIMPVTGLATFELIQVLSDQISFHAIACDKREGFLKDFKFS